MVGSERLLVDRQRSLVERLGVGVATVTHVEHSQVVQRSRDVGMVGAEHLFFDRQRLWRFESYRAVG